jgi:gluconate 2-dehydrogenase gamma chain
MPSLTDLQMRTLAAAIDRIVPADDFPSATQAGCIEFLLRLIDLEGLGDFYRSGLDGLVAEAAKHGASFADLTSQNQDAQLKRCQGIKRSQGWRVSPREFIDTLARQTIEGYYSDPGNGGNRGGVAWEMVGFKVTA